MKHIIIVFLVMLFPVKANAGFLLMQMQFEYQKAKMLQQRMDSLSKVGKDLFECQMYEEATPCICEYATYQMPNILDSLMHCHSEDQRYTYWARYRDVYVKQIPFLAYQLKADTLTSIGFDASLFSKGVLLNTSTTLKQLITETRPSMLEIYNDYEELDMACRRVEENDTCTINKEVASLFMHRDSLDSILREEMPFFFSVEEILSVSWKDVQSALDDKDVAIDFIEIPMDDNNNLYAAYVVKNSYVYPKLIPLFTKSELPISNAYPIVDESVAYSKIWHPLQDLLEGCENLYFSPAGVLNRIAVEYLPDERGLPISWLYSMHRLSNLRELVMDEDSVTTIKKVGLVGGLDYDVAIPQNRYDNKKNKHRGTENTYFNDLPSSLEEVQNIKEILEEKNVIVEAFTGRFFTEDSVKKFNGEEYDILHFATHGFCLNNKDSNSREQDALTRSGMPLSGANEFINMMACDNNYVSTPSDNILTSLEISKMNLINVDMVILSTCVSGLGISGEDGVYGLQRAFKKAGVKSQIVSLWEIEDEATSIFVTSFYRYYVQLRDKFRALKLAQQALCVADKGRYNHPQYWAAFILVDGVDSISSKEPHKKRSLKYLISGELELEKARKRLKSIESKASDSIKASAPKYDLN